MTFFTQEQIQELMEAQRTLKWLNSDGRLFTDKEIQERLNEAKAREDYEYAAECRDELKLRAEEKNMK